MVRRCILRARGVIPQIPPGGTRRKNQCIQFHQRQRDSDNDLLQSNIDT